jgi:hypothetical protein
MPATAPRSDEPRYIEGAPVIAGARLIDLSSMKLLPPSAWWARRMPRREGEVLRFGTAMVVSQKVG